MIDKSGKKFCDADVLRGGVSKFGQERTKGGGGVKKGQIFADVLYGCPLTRLDLVAACRAPSRLASKKFRRVSSVNV